MAATAAVGRLFGTTVGLSRHKTGTGTVSKLPPANSEDCSPEPVQVAGYSNLFEPPGRVLVQQARDQRLIR
jgi:hypothetical protein